MGKPFGAAPSGTVEEIREFMKAGKPVLLYFSNQPVAPDSINPEQWEKLQAFKKEIRNAGLQQDYTDVSNFRELLTRHLDDVINRITNGLIPASAKADNAGFDDSIRAQLNTVIARLSAEWESERDSEPMSTDDAKYILANAAEQLLQFISLDHAALTPELKQGLRDAVKNMKQMQRHQVYLDGGKSFDAFWQLGDQIIKELTTLATGSTPLAAASE